MIVKGVCFCDAALLTAQLVVSDAGLCVDKLLVPADSVTFGTMFP